ncbi:MAG: ABC transporter permease/substrate-binding protein [Bacteroidota bacterium]
MIEFFEFLSLNQAKLWEQVLEHIGLTFASLLLAVLLAVPLGIWIEGKSKVAGGVLGFTGILQTIPSIALLGFLIPVMGIGVKPAIFALFLYALLPILRNTYTGLKGVDPNVIEAAIGMGMTPRQVLFKVKLPLAMPVLFAGIRTATVINVGVATLAAYIGAGGLGEFIFGGISLNNSLMILAGAIPAALLAVIFDQLLARIQKGRKRNASPKFALWLLMVPLLTAFSLLPKLEGLTSAGFDPEFIGRADGYAHLQDVYGVELETVALSSALMYKAVQQGEVDVICGYSTDGRIEAYDLVSLEDDRHAFPPYYCAPIIRQATLKKHPELLIALEKLSGRLNDARMTRLNYEVDFNKESPEAVAERFLKEEDLWQADRKNGGEVITIGGKTFTEQHILIHLFAQLINGYTDLDVEIKADLGGTQVCFEALKVGGIDLYPEYTGTGFVVILSPDEQKVEELIVDADGVYNYVKQAFAEQYQIQWLPPLGFNNTYAVMTRRSLAAEKGWKKVSDLSTP